MDDLVINLTPAAPIYTKSLSHAGMWSGVISRGKTLRLTALEGGANVGLLLYNADVTTERYNLPTRSRASTSFIFAIPTACIPTWAGCSPRSSPTRSAGTTPYAAAPTPGSLRPDTA